MFYILGSGVGGAVSLVVGVVAGGGVSAAVVGGVSAVVGGVSAVVGFSV